MQAISVTKLGNLISWDDQQHIGENPVQPNATSVTFSPRSIINQKVYVCQGGICNLELDCIVLPINEMTLKLTSLSKDVHRVAGTSLSNFYKTLRGVKTGTAVFGSGFDLPARYIIHAMEPGMNEKFQSAVENAVHRCYRNAMETAHEKKLRSVGFCPLYEKTNSPTLCEEMIHIALSTIRCCLDKFGDDFDAVVFTLSEDELESYLKLMPAYFPRSLQEAIDHSHVFASRKIGCWGEKMDEERAIRITDLPIKTAISDAADNIDPIESEDSVQLSSHDVTKHSFSSMSGDHDKSRLNRIKRRIPVQAEPMHERIYRRMLRLAHAHDLSALTRTNILRLCGTDRDKARVVTIVPKYIDLTQTNPEEVLFYFIHTLDPVVNELYTLVYFHTMTEAYNQPSLSLVKRIYNVLDMRYSTNLKRLLMVHPSVSSRLLTWFFTTFSATGIKDQVKRIRSIPELHEYVEPCEIVIPPFVSDYDLKVNHQAYVKHAAKSSQTSDRRESL